MSDPQTYERLRYAPFAQDAFEYRAFITGPYEMHGTGSGDVKVPFLAVDGNAAYWVYGTWRASAETCPSCRAAVGGTLMINPLDWDHRYYICPVCGVVSRWEAAGNVRGARLADAWRVNAAARYAELDEDVDFPDLSWS